MGIEELAFASTVLASLVAGDAVAKGTLSPQERLGKALFFDKNLSFNGNQSCATCHGPEVGWTGPDSSINAHGTVYEGSIPGAFGDRKPPTAAYGGDSPRLRREKKAGVWIGGMFWDGRATGETLGDPLAEQAQGPFLNPNEHALPNAEAVIGKVRAAAYAGLFGERCKGTDTTELYNCIGRAIAAYERSSEVSPFTSKYDHWLKGRARLTAEERLGRKLFQGKAKCAACHLSEGRKPLFPDFTYDNLGIPGNPDNPAYAENPSFADPGLGGFLKIAGHPEAVWQAELGKHKVPTLRNVGKRPAAAPAFVKAFGHNGSFKSLEEITHFYNTRDVPGAGWNGRPWPAPEMATNMNTAEMGNLGLSVKEEAAIVAFMKTLSDGYVPHRNQSRAAAAAAPVRRESGGAAGTKRMR